MPLRLLPLAVGPAILLPLAVYAFRHRRVRGAIWYCVLLLAIALWSTAYAWELAAPDFADKLLALRIKYVGVIALPVAWIGFVLDFVASERAVVRRATSRLGIVAGLILLAAWTNEWHELFWGPLTLDPSGTLIPSASVRVNSGEAVPKREITDREFGAVTGLRRRSDLPGVEAIGQLQRLAEIEAMLLKLELRQGAPDLFQVVFGHRGLPCWRCWVASNWTTYD